MCTNNTCNPEVDCPNENDCPSGSDCTNGSVSNCPTCGGPCSGNSCNNGGSCCSGSCGSGTIARSINVVPSTKNLFIGQSYHLCIDVDPVTASAEVEWYSDNENAVTVGPNGHIIAVGIGCANIVATTTDGQNLRDFCFVRVKEVPPVLVTNITLNRDTITLQKGGASFTLCETVCPENASNPSVRWYSDNENIARVEDGEVFGVGPGNATIVAEALDGSDHRASCFVTVEDSDLSGFLPVKLVRILGGSDESVLALNEKLRLKAALLPATARDRTVNWESSEEEVATVEVFEANDGPCCQVLPHKAGTTTIKAYSVEDNTKCDFHTVTVTDSLNVPDIIMKHYERTFTVGESASLIVAFTLKGNADPPLLTWESSNTGVVTVGDQVPTDDDDTTKEDGEVEFNVTPCGVGNAEVTVKSENGLESTCLIHVVANPPVAASEEHDGSSDHSSDASITKFIHDDSASQINSDLEGDTCLCKVDSDGMLMKVTDENQTAVVDAYDENFNLFEAKDSLVNSDRKEYNDLGKSTFVTDKRGDTKECEYEAGNNTVATVYADGDPDSNVAHFSLTANVGSASGAVFDSPEEAVLNFAQTNFNISRLLRLEIGAKIYFDKSVNKYGYTAVTPGRPHTCFPYDIVLDDDQQEVAAIHTHINVNIFGPDDKGAANAYMEQKSIAIPLYVITPCGRILRYDYIDNAWEEKIVFANVHFKKYTEGDANDDEVFDYVEANKTEWDLHAESNDKCKLNCHLMEWPGEQI